MSWADMRSAGTWMLQQTMKNDGQLLHVTVADGLHVLRKGDL